MKHFLVLVLLVCFLVLHKAVTYALHLFGVSLVLYAAAWVVILILLYYLILAVCKSSRTAIIATAVSGGFMLAFGDMQDSMQRHLPFTWMYSTWVLVPVFILVMAVYIIKGRGNRQPGGNIYSYLLAVVLLLNLFELFRHFTGNSNTGKSAAAHSLPSLPPGIRKPDIYYIIFDAYTSDSCLSGNWQFRNDSLTAYLKRSGFYVSGNAKSIYDFTPLSLLSTFNMDTLQLSQDERKADFRNFNVFRHKMAGNTLFRLLRQNGYSVQATTLLSDSVDLDGFYPFAPDEPLHWLRRHTIERLWLNPWMLDKVRKLFSSTDGLPPFVTTSVNNLHAYNNQVFQTIVSPQPAADPRFVYGHFFIPHSPYIYDSAGQVRRPPNLAPLIEDSLNYLEQVKYCNTLIRKFTNEILQQQGEKIIIIQGDHGYRSHHAGVDPRARLGILNAVYFPNRNYAQLTDTFVSVNTFRVMLNNCFGQRLPLLPGR